MYVFGITGGTGSGKSTVSHEFEKLGVHICDCDKIARLVVEPGTACLNMLTAYFGKDILNSDKTLNRRRLAELAFTDNERLKTLNEITHRYIKEYIENDLKNSTAELCAIDGAVLIGSNVVELCKCLVVVTAEEKVRLSRITARDRISEDEARKRIGAQMSEKEYLSYADYVIENNENIARLGEQIEQIYNKIKTNCEAEKKT